MPLQTRFRTSYTKLTYRAFWHFSKIVWPHNTLFTSGFLIFPHQKPLVHHNSNNFLILSSEMMDSNAFDWIVAQVIGLPTTNLLTQP